jgi:hypothetical protein
MRINFDNLGLVAITATFTLMFPLYTHTYAFHENLGNVDLVYYYQRQITV